MNAGTANIHRYLDTVFAGRPVTADLQDLKEELRASLSARVAELTDRGMSADEAAARAIAELGDINPLIDGVAEDAPSPQSHRVRPRPAFVVSTVLLALALVAAATLVVLTVFGFVVIGIGAFAPIAAGLLTATITATSLLQETTSHYPCPPARSWLYGLSGGSCMSGVGLGAIAITPERTLALLATGIVLLLLGIVGLVALGATQTNRTKSWVFEQYREVPGADRFSTDPAAAARFGMYTLVICILAIAAFVILTITVGIVWSWLAIVAGIAVFFLVLARMLFGPDSGKEDRD